MSNLLALSFRDFWTKKIILWSFLPLIMVLLIFFTLFIIGGGALLDSVKTGLETGNYGFIEQYKILSWFLHLTLVHYLMYFLFYSLGFIFVIIFSVIIALIIAGLLTPIITAEIDARHYQFNISPKANFYIVIKEMAWVFLKFIGLFLLCLPLCFIPGLGLIVLHIPFFYLFYKFFLVDIYSNTVSQDDFLIQIKQGGGSAFIFACFIFYLLCLIPLAGLFLQLFFVIYLTHLVYRKKTIQAA
ncbi:MAG: EI24 domain-containing protein [Neisseriaceae bacterium]|nr:EI24 domain-containing protein [Neisseriaceae bacterium]